MIDNDGRPRPNVTSSQGDIHHSFRFISSNDTLSTQYATHLILALETSFQSNQLSQLVDQFLSARSGAILPVDLQDIKDKLALSDFDQLLHYLNSNQRAFSIIHSIFEPSKYDTPQDLYEYTWTELEETSVDTTNRTYIVVSENTSTTIIYFTPQHLLVPDENANPRHPPCYFTPKRLK
jgi:hypothetical protein